jgi:hypothetical protein
MTHICERLVVHCPDQVGAMFGASRGRRIAHVSGRDVLRSIANQVETARAHNDAAHAGHSPLTCLPRDRAARSTRLPGDREKPGTGVGAFLAAGIAPLLPVTAAAGRPGAVPQPPSSRFRELALT